MCSYRLATADGVRLGTHDVIVVERVQYKLLILSIHIIVLTQGASEQCKSLNITIVIIIVI